MLGAIPNIHVVSIPASVMSQREYKVCELFREIRFEVIEDIGIENLRDYENDFQLCPI